MRRLPIVPALVLLTAACASGQDAVGEVDDRPPPFRDRGAGLFWSTDDQPDDAWFENAVVQFRLPILLVPSPPPQEAPAAVSLRISNIGFDRYVDISSNSPGIPWLWVAASNTIEPVLCDSTSEVVIRGGPGCLAEEGMGRVVLSWEEGGWVHQARWTQSAAAAKETHTRFFREWLEGWSAVG